MKIHQISLFLENKPGHLRAISETLSKAGINILTLSLADTQQFGIVRLIVRDWEKAKRELEAAGLAVNIREVVAATVPDRPGGFAEVLTALDGSGVNIEYMYAFAYHQKGNAIMVFRFDDPDKAIDVLTKAGYTILDEQGIISLTE